VFDDYGASVGEVDVVGVDEVEDVVWCVGVEFGFFECYGSEVVFGDVVDVFGWDDCFECCMFIDVGGDWML